MPHRPPQPWVHHPLEFSGDEFRQQLEQAACRIAEFLDSLPQQAAADLDEVERRARGLMQPLPERGRPLEELLDQLFQQVFPVGLNTTSPGYLAYIPGGGLPQAALADLIALTTNRYVGLWSAAPVAATIEAATIRWFCDLVGYGPSSGGFLTSGGSLANWAALVVARELCLPDDFRRGVIYTSHQAHHSVMKAASMAGFDRSKIRRLPVDERCRVRFDGFQDLLDEDRSAGHLPVAIVAHAGTTNTGAVDDLNAAADTAERAGLWLHVDAAYGGFFLLTERGRTALRGIERADSVTLDPHKGLFLPYGTGCLVVREREPLRNVFAMRGEYMTATAPGGDCVDFCDISPELSREFRGLRVWLPLQMHGAEAFRHCLDEKLDLARHVERELQALDGVELMAPSPLSMVVFRFRHPAWSESHTNERNRELLDRINASRRVRLSATTIGDQFVLRICILSFRTHQDRIDELVELIRQVAASLSQDFPAGVARPER